MTDDISREELRLWTTDADGRKVLRGLTAEETNWYLQYGEKELARRLGGSQPWTSNQAFEADRARWRELNRTHELARAETILGDEKRRMDAEEAKQGSKRHKRRY